MTRLRPIAIWVTGLVSAAITFGLFFQAIGLGRDGYDLGALAGALAFTCFRLWITTPTLSQVKETLPVFDLKGGRLQGP